MSDLRTTVLSKMAALALKKAALKEVLAPHETQIAIIQKAAREATAADLREIESLEDEIKKLAAEDPAAVFGTARTLKAHQLSLGVRNADKVELLGEEDEVISAIEKLADSKDKAQRLAALACLRIEKSLNKPFIRQQYAESPEWFEALGITVTEYVSTSLTEVKPPRSKLTVEVPKSKDEE